MNALQRGNGVIAGRSGDLSSRMANSPTPLPAAEPHPVPAAFSALLVCLSVWLTVVVASGAVAGILFPSIHTLRPIVPSVAILKDDHWKLIAGYPAQTVFMIARNGGIALCLISVALAWMNRGLNSGVIGKVRLVSHAAAALTLISFCVLTARMNSTLAEQRAALFAGDEPLSLNLEAKFSQLHPVSTTILSTLAILLLTTLVTTIIAGSRGLNPTGASRS